VNWKFFFFWSCLSFNYQWVYHLSHLSYLIVTLSNHDLHATANLNFDWQDMKNKNFLLHIDCTYHKETWHYMIKFVEWLVTGRWFSLSTLVSSTNKTDCHDLTELLLKVALSIIDRPTDLSPRWLHELKKTHLKKKLDVSEYERQL
jgi:hypothetical protein